MLSSSPCKSPSKSRRLIMQIQRCFMSTLLIRVEVSRSKPRSNSSLFLANLRTLKTSIPKVSEWAWLFVRESSKIMAAKSTYTPKVSRKGLPLCSQWRCNGLQTSWRRSSWRQSKSLRTLRMRIHVRLLLWESRLQSAEIHLWLKWCRTARVWWMKI